MSQALFMSVAFFSISLSLSSLSVCLSLYLSVPLAHLRAPPLCFLICACVSKYTGTHLQERLLYNERQHTYE